MLYNQLKRRSVMDTLTDFLIADYMNAAGNVIASVCPSLRPSIHLFPFYLHNRLTVDFELLRVSRL